MHRHLEREGSPVAVGRQERERAGCGLLGEVPTFLPVPPPLAPEQRREPSELESVLGAHVHTAGSPAPSWTAIWPPALLLPRARGPGLPTPCRSLSVLRQGAMARPGPAGTSSRPVGKQPGVAGRAAGPHFLPLFKLPLGPPPPPQGASSSSCPPSGQGHGRSLVVRSSEVLHKA